jgi:diacylglycerol kinase (ATP)
VNVSSLKNKNAHRKVLVIYNPTAGWRRRRRFEQIISTLVADGVDVDVRATTKRGDAEQFAGEASAEKYDVVAIAGGDGTINEAINGLSDQSPPLAVIPLGTANVLAHEIGQDNSVNEIAKTIAHGQPKNVAIGLVNGRRFVMMAGFGFDAYVVNHVQPKIKRLLGKMAYVLSTLRALCMFSFPAYRVSINGESVDVASAVIANGRYYGGKFVCAREAHLEDARLHAVLFLKPGVLRTLRYAVWLALNRLHKLPDVRIIPATEIAVAYVDDDPVQGDGDIVAHLPAQISLAPRALALLMPS